MNLANDTGVEHVERGEPVDGFGMVAGFSQCLTLDQSLR